MTRQSVLQLGSVLLDAMQRNPQATLADLREEVVKLEDALERLIEQHGNETTLEEVFRRMPVQ